MNEKELKKIISKGEGIDIEFKESRNALNKDVFETVCAFLKRKGGHLILGVKDNGKIIGVENPLKKEQIPQVVAQSSPQVVPQVSLQATPQDTPQAEELSKREMAILDFCKIPRSADEIGKFINIKDRKHLRNSILKPLLEKKLLKLTIPDKPNSPKQKYLSALKEIKNNE